MIKGDELLYRRIQRYIDGLLEGGTLKEGDRLLSEREIGKLFNASLIPVRRAMQPLIDEGVLEKVQGRGTFIRRTRRPAPRTNRIGVLHCHSSEGLFGSPFYLGIMGGIEQGLQQAGKMLLLGTFARGDGADPVGVLDELIGSVDGVLFLDMQPSIHAKLAGRLGRLTKPAVVINFEEDIPGIDSVVTDSRGNAAQLTGRLTAAGCRRIMCLYGAHEPEVHPNFRNRIAGYRDALAAAGLPVDESLIVNANAAGAADLDALLGDSDRVDGVFCTGTHLLYGQLLPRLAEHGLRVPADVSVVTYDDLPMCAATAPGFTAVDQPLDGLGRTAVRLLLEKCDGPWTSGTRGCRMVLPAAVIDRGSVRSDGVS